MFVGAAFRSGRELLGQLRATGPRLRKEWSSIQISWLYGTKAREVVRMEEPKSPKQSECPSSGQQDEVNLNVDSLAYMAGSPSL